MKDMQRRMSPARYRNALLAETAFWDLRMNKAAGWERTLRLALRLVKQWLRKDSAELRRITWQALMRRLFTSRRRSDRGVDAGHGRLRGRRPRARAARGRAEDFGVHGGVQRRRLC